MRRLQEDVDDIGFNDEMRLWGGLVLTMSTVAEGAAMAAGDDGV